MSSKVVIGANYGDEGKGLITDYLVRKYGLSYAARFNGGAQAGHTVVDENRRHVFSHIASGTFAGAGTILTRDFIVNPILFRREYAKFTHASVWVDYRAEMSTPYDMFLNQFSVAKQGHNSCGLGINETVKRGESFCQISVEMTEYELRRTLKRIKAEWVPRRIQELGLELTQEQVNLIEDKGIIDSFIDDVNFFQTIAMPRNVDSFTDNHIVFEGAQGLGLDQTNGTFPYVTRSNTGILNVSKMRRNQEITEVFYVTRAYLTRHGIGPMEHECEKPYDGIVEKTNVFNQYQGDFRYGLLDIDALRDRIRTDLSNANGLRVFPKIAVTCLDQVGDEVRYIKDGLEFTCKTEEFSRLVARHIGVSHYIESYGPSAYDVRDEKLAI
jgi:adenylosuccinate synthase